MLKNRGLLTLAALALLVPACAQEVKRGGENLLHRAQVEYPAEAIGNKIEGTVVIEARLDEKGIVRDARVLSGPDLLRAAALKSVLDWRYSTEQMVLLAIEIAIDFKLPKDQLDPVPKPGRSGMLKSIVVHGTSAELKEMVLARIAFKVGDTIPEDSHPQIVQAIKNLDEHLDVFIDTSDNITYIGVILAGTSIPGGGSYKAPKRVIVAGNVQSANLIHHVNPTYPALALESRIQGIVKFRAVIATDGKVRNLQLVSGHYLLGPSAREAVTQWVYKPTLLNGTPVEVQTEVDVNYMLPDTPTVQNQH